MKQTYFTAKLKLTALLLFVIVTSQNIAAQNQTVEISGVVNDKEVQGPLPGATVLIKGTSTITATNEKGEFYIKTQIKYPFTLIFSGVGFKSQEVQALTRSIDISNDLFMSARADYMEVLLTQRDALDSKFDLIETKLQQMNASVNVYRALGGGAN